MIAAVVLTLVAGIVLGYAARQRQDLLEARDNIGHLLGEIVDLTAVNRELRNDAAAHVSTIEMVLREVDGSS